MKPYNGVRSIIHLANYYFQQMHLLCGNYRPVIMDPFCNHSHTRQSCLLDLRHLCTTSLINDLCVTVLHWPLCQWQCLNIQCTKLKWPRLQFLHWISAIYIARLMTTQGTSKGNILLKVVIMIYNCNSEVLNMTPGLCWSTLHCMSCVSGA